MNKEIREGLMTVRPVANGWVVTATSNNPGEFVHDIDTFVFNNIEDLCTAFRVFYGDEEAEGEEE